jgi:hypothetical protein
MYDLNKQLNNLLEYLSYRSSNSSSPISSDFFTLFISASLTESYISSSTSNNSMLIIDRVEFVSETLNKELFNLIRYCLNATIQNGAVSLINTSTRTQPSTMLSFSSILPNHGISSSSSTDNLKRLIYASQNTNKLRPVSVNDLVDLLCCAFETSTSLFLFRVSLLLASYSHNNINKKVSVYVN